MKTSIKTKLLIWSILLFIPVLYAVNGCGGGGGSSSGDPYSVSGYIIDRQNNPLNGVKVTVGSKSTTTNSTGYYSIKDLKSGSYTLSASLEGYKEHKETVTVSDKPFVLGIALNLQPVIESLSNTEGGEGLELTIKGKSFGDEKRDSTITFGGVEPDEITKWTNTEIVCIVPTGAKSGSLIITVDGETTSKDITFNVYRYFLFVVNYSGSVTNFIIDPFTGELTKAPGDTLLTGWSPSHFASSPSGKFVYTSNFRDDTISGFEIDTKTGEVSAIPDIPTTGISAPFDIVIDPSGKYLYIENTRTKDLSLFNIEEETGRLSLSSYGPYSIDYSYGNLLIIPSGSFLYSLYTSSNKLSGYRIDPSTGALTQISGSPFEVIASSNLLTDFPGNIMYAGGYYLHTYLLDQTTGNISEMSYSPWANYDMSSLTLEPKNRFAYYFTDLSRHLCCMKRDSETGELTQIDDSTIQLDGYYGDPDTAGPTQIAVDPTGNYLYLFYRESPKVSIFKIDQTTGKLTEIPGSPYITEKRINGGLPLKFAQ